MLFSRIKPALLLFILCTQIRAQDLIIMSNKKRIPCEIHNVDSSRIYFRSQGSEQSLPLKKVKRYTYETIFETRPEAGKDDPSYLHFRRGGQPGDTMRSITCYGNGQIEDSACYIMKPNNRKVYIGAEREYFPDGRLLQVTL